MADHGAFLRLKLFIVAFFLLAYCSQATYIPGRRQLSNEVSAGEDAFDYPEVVLHLTDRESSSFERRARKPPARPPPVRPSAPVAPTPSRVDRPVSTRPSSTAASDASSAVLVPSRPSSSAASVAGSPTPLSSRPSSPVTSAQRSSASTSSRSTLTTTPRPVSSSRPATSSKAKKTCKARSTGLPKRPAAIRQAAPNSLSKREDPLFKKWKDAKDKSPATHVRTGESKLFKLALGKNQDITTAQFFGCTIIVWVSGPNVILAHARQEKGDSCPLDSAAGTSKEINDRLLQEKLDEVADGCDTIAYVAGSSAANGPGVNTLREFIEAESGGQTRFKYSFYKAGSISLEEDTDTNSGKLMVQWVSANNQGGTLKIFDQRETAVVTITYDGNFAMTNVVGM